MKTRHAAFPLATLLLGCAALGFGPEGLLRSAEEDVKRREIDQAWERLSLVRTRYPESSQSREAFVLATDVYEYAYIRDRFQHPDSEWLAPERAHFLFEWLESFVADERFPEAEARRLFRGLPYGFFRQFEAWSAGRPRFAGWALHADDDNGIVQDLSAKRV